MASIAPTVADLPSALRALADPIRWRIVQMLASEELCVCHLVDELELSQPLVSHHLRVLRDAKLVTGERWRYWTYYRLDHDLLAAAASALEAVAHRPEQRKRRPCC